MQKIRLHGLFRWILAIMWTVFLSVILLQPEAQPIIPTGIQPAPPSLKRELFFSSMHLVIFGLTALIWCYAVFNHKRSWGIAFALMMVLFIYGLGMEYIQSNIPGRSTQWWDMLANGIGITLGFAVWHIVTRHADTQTRHLFT